MSYMLQFSASLFKSLNLHLKPETKSVAAFLVVGNFLRLYMTLLNLKPAQTPIFIYFHFFISRGVFQKMIMAANGKWSKGYDQSLLSSHLWNVIKDDQVCNTTKKTHNLHKQKINPSVVHQQKTIMQ